MHFDDFDENDGMDNSAQANSDKLLEQYERKIARNESVYFEEDEFEEIIVRLSERKDIKNALQAAKTALSIHPFSAILMIRQAQLFGFSNQIKKAFDLLSVAESFEPANENIFLTKGAIYSHINEHDKAIACYKTALKHTNDDDEVLMMIAMEYEYKKDYERAIIYLRKAIEVNPENEFALYELAWCFEEAGKLNESISFYHKLIDKNPYSVSSWYNLGIAYNKLEEFDKAIEAFDYAIAIDESFSAAYFNKANSLANLERYREAIAVYKETFEFENPDAFAFYNLGECYERLNELDKAEKNYQKAIRLEPEMAMAHVGMAVIADLKENYLGSVHYMKKALEIEDKNDEYWHILADFHHKSGFEEDALVCYEHALEINPQNWEARLDYSLLIFNNSNESEAIELVLEGIELDKSNYSLWYRIAAMYLLSGQRQKGFLALIHALENDFDSRKIFFDFDDNLALDTDVCTLIDSYQKN
jgi:tetratricopeptide (TPR) repeat protein